MSRDSRFMIPSVRVRWQPRDLFAARDCTVESAIESRWRQLHLRAVHRTWGIALGLHAASSDAGDLLLVGPGLAFDVCQREMLLDHPLLIAPPPVPAGIGGSAWWFDLVARLVDGSVTWRWLYAGTRGAIDAEPPLLAGEAHPGLDLPIARVVLSAAGTIGPVDSSHRRGARRTSARLVSGRVSSGATLDTGGTFRRWSFTVNLSAARFRRPPIVFASVEAHPLQAILFSAAGEYLLGPFVEVGTATVSSVTLRVTAAMSPAGTVVLPATTITTLPVGIRWLAIEPPDIPEPAISLARARTPEGATAANLATRFTRLRNFPPPGGVTVT